MATLSDHLMFGDVWSTNVTSGRILQVFSEPQRANNDSHAQVDIRSYGDALFVLRDLGLGNPMGFCVKKLPNFQTQITLSWLMLVIFNVLYMYSMYNIYIYSINIHLLDPIKYFPKIDRKPHLINLETESPSRLENKFDMSMVHNIYIYIVVLHVIYIYILLLYVCVYVLQYISYRQSNINISICTYYIDR